MSPTSALTNEAPFQTAQRRSQRVGAPAPAWPRWAAPGLAEEMRRREEALEAELRSQAEKEAARWMAAMEQRSAADRVQQAQEQVKKGTGSAWA